MKNLRNSTHKFMLFFSFFISLFVLLPEAQSYPSLLLAECHLEHPTEEMQLNFRVLQDSEQTLVEVDQKHPRFPEPTHSIRHVNHRLTHDFWEFSNHYDFTLLILPGQKGSFSGNLLGVHYQQLPLVCKTHF